MWRALRLPAAWSITEKYSSSLQALAHGTWRLRKEKPLGVVGVVIVLVLRFCAALFPWIATHPDDQAQV